MSPQERQKLIDELRLIYRNMMNLVEHTMLVVKSNLKLLC